MLYTPSYSGEDTSLSQELQTISQVLADVDAFILPKLYEEPEKPRGGMVRYADGAVWDPGQGEQPYFFDGTLWLPLSSPYYKKTPVEIAKGVTIVNYSYLPCNVLRYGDNDEQGVTDMITAILAAIAVAKGSNGGIVYLPNGIYATSAEILIDANILFRGDGFLSVIKPLTETFAPIRVEAAIDSGSASWGIEDLHIAYAAQATNPLAVGIKLDDSGGATRFPDGGHIHRVNIDWPYIGFMDDTVAWNMDIKQLAVFEPYFKGILLDKDGGTMYSLDKIYVRADDNTDIAIDIAGLHYLKMTGCGVDHYNGSRAAVSIVTCTGVIDSLDIEGCETSIANSGLLNLYNFTGVVQGRFPNNILTGNNGAVISTGGSGRGRVILNGAVVVNTTAGAANNAHGVVVASSTDSLQINGGGIEAPTGGSGSHTEIKDVGKIANRFDENGLVLRSITCPTEVVTSANVITTVENGKTFYLNNADGFPHTLPPPELGLEYEFIVQTAPVGGAYTIGSDSGDNVMFGTFLDIVGELTYFASKDEISFVAGTAVVGDRLKVKADASRWYCKAKSGADGGIATSVT